MGGLKGVLNRRLTLAGAFVVVLVLGLAGGTAYWLYEVVTARVLEARVDSAIPGIATALRKQRAAIEHALEEYKAQFGDYPADHLLNQNPPSVDPVTNTLLYELDGTLYLKGAKKVQVAGLEPAEEDYVTNYFQCSRFRNFSSDPGQLKHFLRKEYATAQQLHDDPDVFALGFNITQASIPDDLFWVMEGDVSSWRYVHSAPKHNPGKFDLWIELKTKDRAVTIGNWKEAE